MLKIFAICWQFRKNFCCSLKMCFYISHIFPQNVFFLNVKRFQWLFLSCLLSPTQGMDLILWQKDLLMWFPNCHLMTILLKMTFFYKTSQPSTMKLLRVAKLHQLNPLNKASHGYLSYLLCFCSSSYFSTNKTNNKCRRQCTKNSVRE